MKKLAMVASLFAIFSLTGCGTMVISKDSPLTFQNTISDLDGDKVAHTNAIIDYFETKNVDGRPLRFKHYPEKNKVYAYGTKHSKMFDKFECLNDFSITTNATDDTVVIDFEIIDTPSQSYSACASLPTTNHYNEIKSEFYNILQGIERAVK